MAFKKGGGKKVSVKKQKHGFVRASSSKGSNPFDVRGNASKQKHEVIGRRVKGAGRNVAAARAEAERKRRKTLGAEFNARNKSNVFKDKRLGEQDPTLSMEDKMMARFQTERKRKLRNASAFALHDSDSEQDDDDALFLTHKGAKITDDDYDQLNADGPLDDEDDSAEGRKMDRDIVNQLHFGGGKGDNDEGDGKRKTHKEVMHEVMMKAKLYKAERQKNKSSQEDATDKLDEGFADVRGLLEFRPTRANGKELLPKEPMDDFDKLTREFAFEAKAKATERRMSPEEAAAKERDRLAELEKKRVARMNGADEESDSDSDGKRKKGKKSKKKTPQLIMMPPTDDDLTDGYAVDERFAAEEAEEEDNDEEESDEESESDSEAESDDDKEEKKEEEPEEDKDEDSDDESDKLKRQQDAEEAAAELPFVFECPESPEELASLFKQHARNSPEKRGLILERIVTYYNPRLSVENKNKMKRFFAVLVRQLLIFAARYAGHKHDLDALAKNMYTLAQQMGDTAGIVVRELLAQLFKRLHKRASTSAWPTLPELLLFKALTSVFPTSDLRHNVVSPMETLLGESLARGSVTSPQEATQALFTASLSLDMTRGKERFMPEVVSFLTRILRAFVTSSDENSTHWLRRDLLEWVAAQKEGKMPALPRLSLAGSSSCNGVQVLSALLALLDAASAQYASLPSFDELFYPLYLLLHAIVKQLENNKVSEVNAVISKLHTRLEACWDARRPLRLQSFAPSTLPTFAPHFDENYTVRKDKTAPKDTAQLKQLQRQVKRARKGAARELRRDAEFIHREKQKEEEARLAAKEEKQKEIRRWLEEQNATFNQQVRKGGNMLKGGGSARGPAPRARTPRK
ncbi:nucleolar protein, putative [Phytophthora infestans T30-4]|uniref:Nucleolar protein, putative n=1 Tax=Phytophthora infestans (strain T30-4) TaxID=403677 RepID=D0NQY7_PHYIT|nr:nucleolar protein, putative [Phytophthora infestans T30-4]EEY63085.1 nucleolar protein, putative [Phytophthora infestans T30-4]|eukprot:XP_002898608.1 nucleolar protein, putative [Phytophthora infestans T30-4]